jgi:hypothetical protein
MNNPDLAPVPEDFTIQCAWCRRIEHVGDPTLPTSHSMCPTCVVVFLAAGQP